MKSSSANSSIKCTTHFAKKSPLHRLRTIDAYKYALGLIALLALAVGTTACGGLATPTPSSTNVGASQSTPEKTSATPGATGEQPKPSGIGEQSGEGGAKLATLNLPAVIYGGVKITVVDVKQAPSFSDDNSAQSGVIRLDLQEQNTTQEAAYYLYSEVMRLSLPDGSNVAPGYSKDSLGPDQGVTRMTWIDFPAPQTVSPSNTTLVIGKVAEAQIKIPLKSGADLSSYTPKVFTINQKTQYARMTWTITQATTQLSAGLKQADSGKAFLVISLKIDNPTNEEFFGSLTDIMRLQVGDAALAPDASHSQFPGSLSAGATSTGTCVFLVPQGTTNFTLNLLSESSINASAASIPFQLQ